MSQSTSPRTPDPQRDIVLERVVKASPSLLWRVLTEPEHAKQWTTPLPWVTVECEIDLRPGGIFRTVMRSPEGEESVNLCCFLEIVAEKRLVWTNALLPSFRPAPPPSVVPFITAEFTLQPDGRGTRYVARVMHRDEADRQKHVELGFHDGWGTVMEQAAGLAANLEVNGHGVPTPGTRRG
jgi:uncharacterized protein YndB with AHSA1/START domain